jgi:Domain of unknown function (DUF4157)
VSDDNSSRRPGAGTHSGEPSPAAPGASKRGGAGAPQDRSLPRTTAQLGARIARRRATGDEATGDPAPAVDEARESTAQALEGPIRTTLESSVGDLSAVRVHTGPASQRAAVELGARAYAEGQDIHFAAGEYRPDTAAGKHLIAHEVAHTVQQRGVVAQRQEKLAISQPGDAHEREADAFADAVVAGGASPMPTPVAAPVLARDTTAPAPQPARDVSSASAADQATLAADAAQVAAQRAAHPDQSPLDVLANLARNDGMLRGAYEAPGNHAFRDWMVAFPAPLKAHILATAVPGVWARSLWSTSEGTALIIAWINEVPATWAVQLVPLLAHAEAIDLIAMVDSNLRTAVIRAVHVGGGAVNGVMQVARSCGISLADVFGSYQAAGYLNPPTLRALLDHPDVTVEDQYRLTGSPALSVIRTAAHGQHPHQVFTRLAANQARFVAAYVDHEPLRHWIDSNLDILKATIQGVPPEATWVQTLLDRNLFIPLLSMCDHDRAFGQTIRPALLASYSRLVARLPKPIPNDGVARGLLAVVRDGTGISREDMYATWEALYTARLVRAGTPNADVVSTWTTFGFGYTQTYPAIDPNQEAMKYFFEQYGRIPRAHINLSSGVMMVHHYRLRKNPWIGSAYYINEAGNRVTNPDVPLTTSYYFPSENRVVMQALTSHGSTLGAPSTGGLSSYWGAETAVATQTNQDHPGTTQAMNKFQNHATHEIGHTVGNRALRRAGFDISGDEWTRQYASWQQSGNAEDYARTLGFTTAMDGQSFLLTRGTLSVTKRGREIRELLTRVAEAGKSGAAGNSIARAFNNSVDDALAAIGAQPALSGVALVVTVTGMAGDMPGESYNISSIDGGASRVTFYATRWGNRWVSYDAEAFRHKVSHYSVSSYKEMFAEMYTAYYNGRSLPPGIGTHNPATFFAALDAAGPSEFGLPGSRGRQAGAGRDGGDGEQPTGNGTGPAPREDGPPVDPRRQRWP